MDVPFDWNRNSTSWTRLDCFLGMWITKRRELRVSNDESMFMSWKVYTKYQFEEIGFASFSGLSHGDFDCCLRKSYLGRLRIGSDRY